jgi:hypothetical protein
MALTAHFKLNDNLATTAVVDSGPFSANGTASANTSTLSVAGKINTALHFGGTDYVALGNFARYKPALFVSLWFKRDSTGDATTRWLLLKYGGGAWGWDGWGVYINHNTIGIWLNGNTQDNYFGGTIADDTNWHHVYAEIRRGGSCLLYVDTLSTVSRTDANTIYNENVDLQVGNSFIGSIDDLRFFDAALTSDDISFLYNGGNGTEDDLDDNSSSSSSSSRSVSSSSSFSNSSSSKSSNSSSSLSSGSQSSDSSFSDSSQSQSSSGSSGSTDSSSSQSTESSSQSSFSYSSRSTFSSSSSTPGTELVCLIDKRESEQTMRIYDLYRESRENLAHEPITPETQPAQAAEIRRQRLRYRFSGFRPGSYQGITGIS